MTDAATLRDQAVAAAAAGRADDAAGLFARAASLARGNPSILNSAAAFLARQGDPKRAIALLREAATIGPGAHEAALNLALLLIGEGDADEALRLLVDRQRGLDAQARYWSIRASAERALGRRRDALASYERAVARDPDGVKPQHGRARMALETGQPAGEFYQAAVAAAPNDPHAWLGYAQALEVEGDGEEARRIAGQLLANSPEWVEALEMLAQWRWAAGERQSFTDHYPSSENRAVTLSHCRMLAGVDRFGDAADVAARHRARDDCPELALIEAAHRGEAGDDRRAEAIFATLDHATPGTRLQESRHRLRTGQPDRAETLLSAMLVEQPDHVGAWALRGIAWRLLGDPRSDWLHGQQGLVALLPLELASAQIAAIVDWLDRLHDQSTSPVGQSVRDGTQTRGGLFDRHEPEARLVEQGFRRAVHAYRAGLPLADPTHPTLRRRDDEWTFAGSWSVRLFGAGRHTEHIHPNGLISSAAYFALPPSVDGGDARAGWLELGRPPPDLRLDLPPLAVIEPRVGHCALFPSTLYHGTRPFAAGKRISVAIDIGAGPPG